jgi:hypothetical protein
VIDVRAVVDIEHFDDMGLFVDAVDDAVSSTPRAVTPGQRAEERLADPAGAQGQAGVTELKHRRRHRLRQPFGDSTARGGLEPYLVAFTVHAPL